MGRKMTSLSAGYAICDVLKNAMKEKVTGIYPIMSTNEDAKYPYITYTRGESEREPTKSSYNSDMDSCSIHVNVFDDDYERGLDLMEEVRSVLEGKSFEYVDNKDPTRTLSVRCTRVTSSDEGYDGFCYMQQIIVTCKII